MQNRMTIYMNEADQDNADRLLDELLEQGTPGLVTIGGKKSMAGLFRHLVIEELKRRGMPITPKKLGD